MKPVLLVNGKELEVTSIYYVRNEVRSVQVHLGENKYEHYQHHEAFNFDPDDKLIDFDESLKFKNRYDDLIAHIDEMLKEANDDLTEIAIEAMESNESGLPFNSRLAESQKFYQSEKQRVMGMIDVVEEVKAFAEGFYDKRGDE